MSHTPGPWDCDGTQVYAEHLCICNAYRSRTDDEGNWMPNKEVEANARLIAAAPELLDALHSAKGTIEYLLANADNGPAYNCIEVIAAAIAKAEGQ